MSLPENIIANADDFGFSLSVNKSILYCYEQGYINSTSLMTNKPGFEEAVEMIHKYNIIKNVGLHINLFSSNPITDFPDKSYLLENGEWNKIKTKKTLNFLTPKTNGYFFNEIEAQVKKATSQGVKITHLDAHQHLHTLPAFFPIFLKFAKQYKLKLRLAQTYNEGNFLKFQFRSYINQTMKKTGCNYSDKFETVEYYIKNSLPKKENSVIEVMLHPDFNAAGELTDHFFPSTMTDWLACLPQLT
jgi:predicted glycoside hydrolase/deacetylase ChbG (UPF0249 family)